MVRKLENTHIIKSWNSRNCVYFLSSKHRKKVKRKTSQIIGPHDNKLMLSGENRGLIEGPNQRSCHNKWFSCDQVIIRSSWPHSVSVSVSSACLYRSIMTGSCATNSASLGRGLHKSLGCILMHKNGFAPIVIPCGRARDRARRRVSWLELRRSCPAVCCAVCKMLNKKISNFFCVICICLRSTAILGDPWPYYSPLQHFDTGLAINTHALTGFSGGHPACLSSLAHNCLPSSKAKISLSFVQLSGEINCAPKSETS